MFPSDPITVVPPAGEPVTLARAKLHLRVDHAAEDDLIAGMLAAARARVEAATNRRLLRQTVEVTLDDFPPGPFARAGGGTVPAGSPHTRAVRLPGGRCWAVTWVKYFDDAGAERTLAAGTGYLAHLGGVPGLVYPAPGTTWPTTRSARLGNVAVRYEVGYGTAADVPRDLAHAVLEVLAHQYRLRGDAKDFSDGLPATVRWACDYHRLPEYR